MTTIKKHLSLFHSFSTNFHLMKKFEQFEKHSRPKYNFSFISKTNLNSIDKISFTDETFVWICLYKKFFLAKRKMSQDSNLDEDVFSTVSNIMSSSIRIKLIEFFLLNFCEKTAAGWLWNEKKRREKDAVIRDRIRNLEIFSPTLSQLSYPSKTSPTKQRWKSGQDIWFIAWNKW